ncbi:MAG TPA: hypothetical protein VIU13_15085 [Chryseolinea sp.]
MLPKPPLLLAFLGLFILTTACGPLVPLSYVNGSAGSHLTQSLETNEASVWLQYMQSQHGYMVFDLEIANSSQYELQVAPQMISSYASSKIFATPETGDDVHKLSAPNSTLTMTRHFASDPSSIQRFYYEKAKAKKTGATMFAILTVGLIIFDVASDSKAAQKEISTSRDEWKSFSRDILVTTALTATDVAQSSAQQAAEESHFLPYELFPECTIKPGGNVRGKIFVPIEASHKYVRLVVPVGDEDYVFDFRRYGVKNNKVR